MTDTKKSQEQNLELYNNSSLSKEIIETASARDVAILNAQEAINKANRQEKLADENVEKERKERLDKEARVRADSLWTELKGERKCCWLLALTPKKVSLALLVILEIVILFCWVHNPSELKFKELLAPMLFVSVVFVFIILLSRLISSEEQERVKNRSELEKEVFLRRLK